LHKITSPHIGQVLSLILFLFCFGIVPIFSSTPGISCNIRVLFAISHLFTVISHLFCIISHIFLFTSHYLCCVRAPFPLLVASPLYFCLWFRLTARHRLSFSGAHHKGWQFLGKIPSSQPSNTPGSYPIITCSRAHTIHKELQEVLLCSNQPNSDIKSLFKPTHFELSNNSLTLTSLSSESDLIDNNNSSSHHTQYPTVPENPPPSNIVQMPSSTNPVPSSSALPASNPNPIINPPITPTIAPAPVAPVVAPTMPACNHSTAPKFKSDQPHELR
jgi:hypothetical protein